MKKQRGHQIYAGMSMGRKNSLTWRRQTHTHTPCALTRTIAPRGTLTLAPSRHEVHLRWQARTKKTRRRGIDRPTHLHRHAPAGVKRTCTPALPRVRRSLSSADQWNPCPATNALLLATALCPWSATLCSGFHLMHCVLHRTPGFIHPCWSWCAGVDAGAAAGAVSGFRTAVPFWGQIFNS